MNDIALKTQGQPLPGLKLIKTKTFGLSTPTLNKICHPSKTNYIRSPRDQYMKSNYFLFLPQPKIKFYFSLNYVTGNWI